VNVAGWLFIAVVTVVVEACVRAFDLRDSVAAPSEALRALAEGLASGALLGEIGTTLEAFAEGLALAVVVGVAVGVVIGSSRTLRDAASVVIEFLRPIPAIALIPLAIMFLGLGIPMRRFVVAYAAVWPILVNTLYGVRGSDRMLHDVARTSGASGAARLVRVTLPAALPSIATGVRVGASIGLLACVTAEFLTGTGGIGSYMQQQETAARLPELYAAVILVGAIGYGVNLLLRAAQRRYVFWVGEERVGAR
jgi:NitT/TauT family transport system permease protein